jgi:hypothetical protein
MGHFFVAILIKIKRKLVKFEINHEYQFSGVIFDVKVLTLILMPKRRYILCLHFVSTKCYLNGIGMI